jgi:hypothetical protein
LNEILDKEDTQIIQNQSDLQSVIDVFSQLCLRAFMLKQNDIEYQEVEYRCYSNKSIIVLKYPKLYLNIQKDDPRIILKAFYAINDENHQKKYLFENFKIQDMISFLALEERKRFIIIIKRFNRHF